MFAQRVPGENSQHLLADSCRYIGISHHAPLYGTCLARGVGSTVYDLDGNRYLDLFAGASAVTLGYANPDIIRIYEEQARQMHHTCFSFSPTQPVVDLARELIATMPDAARRHKVLFGLSGSDANNIAIKCAKNFTGRSKVVAFQNAWHGTSGFSRQATSFSQPAL